MDKIVSQYTRSPQNEFYSEQEQELTETLPPISLNFKLPPLDNVSLWLLVLWLLSEFVLLWMAIVPLGL